MYALVLDRVTNQAFVGSNTTNGTEIIIIRRCDPTMKSSVTFLSDSIENQSLPSLPVQRRSTENSNRFLPRHENFQRRSQSPDSINSNKFFSKILNYQKSFTIPPAPKQFKTPELNKINECAVLKVFEHRNFGNSPSNYSRMSEEMSSPYLPKSRSYVQSKARFITPCLRTHYCKLELVSLPNLGHYLVVP